MRCILFLMAAAIALDSSGQVADSLKNLLSGNQLSKAQRAETLIALISFNPYNNADQVTLWANEAIVLAEETGNKLLLAKALNMAGNTNWIKGELGKALELMHRSLDLSVELGDDQLKARNFGNIGNVYFLAGDYHNALHFYHQSLSMYLTQGNTVRSFVLYNNLGNSFLKMRELDSAAKYLKLAQKISVPEIERLKPTLMANLADLAFKQDHLSATDSLLAPTMKIAVKQNDIRAISQVHQITSNLKLKQLKFPEGLAEAKQAYELARQADSREMLHETLEVLAKALSLNGDFKSAFQMQSLSNRYLDTLQNDQITYQLQLFQYSNEQREKILLRQESELNQATAERRQIIIYGLIFTILCVLVFLLTIYNHRNKIKRQSAELEQMNEFKTKLFAIVSHDLRSPVQTFVSLTELLDRNLVTPENLKDQMPEIRQRVKAMVGLLEMMLLWANNNLQGFRSKLVKIHLYYKVAEVISQVNLLYPEKKINLKNLITEDFSINGDEKIINILLNNFIANAFKFSHPGAIVEVSARKKSGFTEISVTDYGVGMTDEQVKSLFTVKTIKSKGTKGEFGSGVGLMLCKDFVKLLGGDIWLESFPGKGTTATFSLPA